MEITVQAVPGEPLASLLQVQGAIDGSNYETLIAQADAVHQTGARRIILDLHACPFLSSGGLIALRRIFDLLQGKRRADAEEGWAAIHALRQLNGSELQWNLVLLNPSPRVDQVLEVSGFKDWLPIYPDLSSAVASLIEHAG